MSEISVIEEWEKQGFSWQYVHAPKMAAITIPANGQVQLPKEGFSYKYPKGIILTASAIFDHPKCGARLVCFSLNLDTERYYTIENGLLGGLTDPEWGQVFIRVPPDVSPGTYVLYMQSLKKWTDSMQLYLINNDSVPHYCLAFYYVLVVQVESKKEAT